jgi:hypothetical protein
MAFFSGVFCLWPSQKVAIIPRNFFSNMAIDQIWSPNV